MLKAADSMDTLEFITTYTKIKNFLGDANIQTALANRKTEVEAFFITLFGDDWRVGYRDFVAKVTEYRELGAACVPLLALGYRVPGLPLEAIFLVAAKVIDYRKGIKPMGTQDKLRAMMNRKRR